MAYAAKAIWSEANQQTQFWMRIVIICKWAKNIMVALVCAVIYCTVLPVLVGFTFEWLISIPVHDFVNESMAGTMLNYWTLGCIFLLFKTKWDLYGVGIDAPGTMAAKLRRVWRDGIQRVDGVFICKEILLCLVLQIADVYLTSYFVSRTLCFLVLNSTYADQTMIIRYTPLCGILFYLLLQGLQYVLKFISSIYEKQMDSKYLIGLELQNNLNAKN